MTNDYLTNFKSKDKLGNLLGAVPLEISKEKCVYEYEVNANHYNPNGTLHGGALFTVMDTCQGAFIHFILDEKYKYAATGTATIRYLAPLFQGKVQLITTLKNSDNRKLILITIARDESGKIVAELEEIWIAILKSN